MSGAFKRIVGIDPGLTGALAFLTPDNPERIAIHDMPAWEGQLDSGAIVALVQTYKPELAVIERNWGKPSRGAVFSSGAAYGALKSTLAGLVQCHLVAPATWRAHFRLSFADKDLVRQRATELWPRRACYFRRRQDHGRADAALIARYGVEVDLGASISSRIG